MSQDLQLFLQALNEVSHGDDVDELKCELELVKEQLFKLDKKNNELQITVKKKDETINSMKRQIINFKKQTAEITYQWKCSMASEARLLEQVKKLNDEIKAKGLLIMSLERERRKLNGEVTLAHSGQGSMRGRTADSSTGRRRSASVDRLSDTRRQLARQLLTANQGQAYAVSRKESTVDSMEKLILLQKMLLGKTRTLAEKDVIIEELNNQISLLKVQLGRLSKVRVMAQELTATRHKLSTTTHQVDQLKAQLEQSNSEIKKLKDKLASATSQ